MNDFPRDSRIYAKLDRGKWERARARSFSRRESEVKINRESTESCINEVTKCFNIYNDNESIEYNNPLRNVTMAHLSSIYYLPLMH